MYNEHELCEKITSSDPDTGQCGINVRVSWNGQEKTWLVHLERVPTP